MDTELTVPEAQSCLLHFGGNACLDGAVTYVGAARYDGPAMTHNWCVVRLRAFRLPGPSRRERAISPSRSLGSERVIARYRERCAGYSCGRGNAVAPACRGRHWQV